MGIGNHKKARKKKLDAAAQENQFIAGLLAEPQGAFYSPAMGIHVISVGSDSLPAPRFVAPWQRDPHAGRSSTDGSDPSGHGR